jgi:hypothetical protein
MGTLVQSEVELTRGYTPAHEARFRAAGEHMQAGILLALRGAAVAGIENESKVADPPKHHFPWADLAIAALTAATMGVAGAVVKGLVIGREAAEVVQKGGKLVVEAEEHTARELGADIVKETVHTGMEKSLETTYEAIREEGDDGGRKAPSQGNDAGGGGASVDFGTRFFEAQKIALIKASGAEEGAAIDMVENHRAALAEDPEGAIRTVEAYAERLRNPPNEAIEHQRAQTRAKYVAALARAAVTAQNEEEDKAHEDAQVKAAMIEKSRETGSPYEAEMARLGISDPEIRKVVHDKRDEERIAKEKAEAGHGVDLTPTLARDEHMMLADQEFHKNVKGLLSIEFELDLENPAAPVTLSSAWIKGLNDPLRRQLELMTPVDMNLPLRARSKISAPSGPFGMGGGGSLVIARNETGDVFYEADNEQLREWLAAKGGGDPAAGARRIIEKEIGNKSIKDQGKELDD